MVTLKLFLGATAAFAVLDFFWLGFVMRDFNMAQLSEIGRFRDGRFDLLYLPAVLTYFLMGASVVFFALPRVQSDDPIWIYFAVGAGMGLVVFGIFDLTNLAILKGYPIAFACADMAWGMLVYGIVTTLTGLVRGLL